MKCVLGPMPEVGPEPSGDWHALREPAPAILQGLALPVGFGLVCIMGSLWFDLLSPGGWCFDLFSVLTVYAALVPLHELVHALAHPDRGLSRRTVFGFWPGQLLAYVHYDGVLTRRRLLVLLLLPLLVITIAPLLAGIVFGCVDGWIVLLSVLNAFGSCMDVLSAVLVLFQVPPGAEVRNWGWRTYWRLPGCEVAAVTNRSATVADTICRDR